MLEKFVPSGYINSARDFFGNAALMPALSGNRSPVPSDDASDEYEDKDHSAQLEDTSSDIYASVSPSRVSSAGATSDAADTDFDSDEAEEDENGDYDEDEDDYSGFDGNIDADSFEPIKGLKPAGAHAKKEFRRAFSTEDLPESEILYKAYSCAFCKEILYQGKMYVTNHYICFVSKFFGLTTTKLVIPFSSVTKIEPRMMMAFIPNSIAIRTNDNRRFMFASFTNRNRTMGFLRKLRNSRHVSSSWSAPLGLADALKQDGQGNNNAAGGTGRGSQQQQQQLQHLPIRTPTFLHDNPSRARSTTAPAMVRSSSDNSHLMATSLGGGQSEGEGLKTSPSSKSIAETKSMADTKSSSQEASGDSNGDGAAAGGAKGSASGNGSGANPFGPDQHAKTSMPGLEENEKQLVLETINAPLGAVANVLFGKDTEWIRHFLVDIEKNRDLKSIPSFEEFKKGAERYYEYVKPLHGPVGPKQTKCNCTEKIEVWDTEKYIEVVTTTATPDVPSGGSFTTVTRAVLAWADNNNTQIRLGTWLDWTGKTWLKGPIEKGAVDGQTSYCKQLVTELNRKLQSGGAAKTESRQASGGIRPAQEDDEKESAQTAKAARKSATAKRAAQAIKEWQQLCTILVCLILVLLVALIVLWRRSPSQPQPSKEQQHDLRRIEQELELWQWIDDRKDPASGAGKKPANDVKIDEAIAVAERRLASLKASLC